MKAVQIFTLAIIAFCGTLVVRAQTWTQTGAPNKLWVAIATSADGSRLIAAAQGASSPYAGPIYTSTNSGATWASNSVTPQSWYSVASSADGQILAAAVGANGSGPICVSTNGGTTWATSGAPSANWQSIKMSADGSKMIAAVSSGIVNGPIYGSTNQGKTWATNGLRVTFGPACSTDGTTLAAIIGQAVFTSSDFGNNWLSNFTGAPVPLRCVAISADGTKLATGIGGNGGRIYMSTNSGTSWFSNNVALVWASIASSTDGTKLVAAGYASIYTTTDQGMTWVSNNAPRLNWYSVASSADGNKLVAATSGGIYLLQNTSSPSLAITLTNGLQLSWLIPSTNLVLQQSCNLGATSWADVTNVPVLNLTNLQNQVTLPLPTTNAFFRLKTP